MNDRENVKRALDAGTASADAWLNRNLLDGGVCDFCARPLDGNEITWMTNDNVKVSFGAIVDGEIVTGEERNYGRGWAACPTCDKIVEKRDPEALAAHHAEYGIAHLTLAPRAGEDREQFFADVHRDLVQLYTVVFEAGLHRIGNVLAGRHEPHDRDEAMEQLSAICLRARAMNEQRNRIEMTDEELVASRRHVLALYGDAIRLDERWHIGIFDPSARAAFAVLEAANSRLLEEVNEQRRAQRIADRAARRAPDVKQEGTRCQCGKAASVNGMCKKHAREAGVLPKGKPV